MITRGAGSNTWPAPVENKRMLGDSATERRYQLFPGMAFPGMDDQNALK